MDLIDRQAAINAICKTDCGACCKIDCDEIKAIKAVPSAQQWIPCTERLPERGVSVLISHVGYVYEDYLDSDDGELFFWNSGLCLKDEKQNIAWMPLPKPYKGENDG